MTDLNNMYGFGARPINQSNPVYQQQKTQKLPETDSQETVILPALQENRQQVPNYYNSYAPQQVPATYTAELPLNPKDGILYKNTGRNLQELKDPTPIILESPFGRMTLTLDSISIYRQGDSAKSHKNYFVEVPLVSVSSASVLTDTAKDGSIRVAVCWMLFKLMEAIKRLLLIMIQLERTYGRLKWVQRKRHGYSVIR